MAFLSMTKMGSCGQGFLLMEALTAILLFASLSLIIGSYWYYAAAEYANARKTLQALCVVRKYMDALLIASEKIPSTSFMDGEFTVHIVKNKLVHAWLLVTLKISWKNQSIAFQAIRKET